MLRMIRRDVSVNVPSNMGKPRFTTTTITVVMPVDVTCDHDCNFGFDCDWPA